MWSRTLLLVIHLHPCQLMSTDPTAWRNYSQSHSTLQREMTYRGPKPHIPDFTKDDPCQFTHLKIALENILPEDATERFKFQIMVDHLNMVF